MTDQSKGYIAALTGTLLIAFSFLFVKIALSSASPLDTLAHRFTITFLGATLLLVHKKFRFRVSGKDILRILPLAVLYPTMFFAFQAFGLMYTTSSEAGIIHATVPIFTLVLATIFLKERTTILQRIFTVFSVTGVVYIFMMSGLNVANYSMTGVIFILISAITNSMYSVLSRKLVKNYSPFQLTYVITALGFITFNVISISDHLIHPEAAGYLAPLMNSDYLFAILYLGIFSSLFSAFLSTYSVSKIEATKMSVFGNLGTLITIIAGVLILNESLQIHHFIGAVIILIGVIGTNFSKAKKAKITTPQEPSILPVKIAR
ncbi:DMT family transporter [Paenibacillus sp. N1-5-1-14]|uniref:DMT family transporter n=1 Tax=Paenibacillus radicibacter TaxID=2972488 RepID=UPI002159191A|nr:DMT family transporter [Paenibacillus radicibacter]MCR8643262.1 DMT family transporter [Paenibacillus radicibacter]